MKQQSIVIGPRVECDLDRLISTRLLIQANSGGGKSWAIRRLLEQTHGKVQQIVIDPEGEFASLRERFDYVLAARTGGDTAADPRTAKLLAERLLELGVSAILDIYELNPDARLRFVKLFLEALVDAPKALWHPVLIVIDEAHYFCPEKDPGESATAVKALCSRGRKRGFCAVLATQRLAKLSKDAAAECNNKLIGRTTLDLDVKRAAEELGLPPKDAIQVLRKLKPGQFFAFGPALSDDVVETVVGTVGTSHPKAGAHNAARVPPPTDAVKALLPKLSDLPAEAEARERTVADLKRDLATVRRELTEARKAQPAAPTVETKTVERFVLKDGQVTRLEQLLDRMMKSAKPLLDAAAVVADALMLARPPAPVAATALVREQVHLPRVSTPRPAAPRRPVTVVDGVSKAEQRILDAVAWWHAANVAGPTRLQVAMVARYTVNGHFNNMVGSLRSKGLVDYPSSGGVLLTDDGQRAAYAPDGDISRDELIRRVLIVLRTDALKKIFSTVVDAGADLTREQLADLTNYTVNGHFNNMVGSLRSLGVIDYPRQGGVRLSDMFDALS